MGYVPVKGGEEAIEAACRLIDYQRLKGRSKPLAVEQILEQLYFAVDRVMSEAGLYAPKLAALAIKQTAGDLFEASFLLRAYKSTLPKLGYTLPVDSRRMRVIRRISAAFRDIPGGQFLGPTPDYCLRLFKLELFQESERSKRTFFEELLKETLKDTGNFEEIPDTFPKVVDILRKEGLIVGSVSESIKFVDITEEPLKFPAPRSAKLQAMARGETGGLLLLAYSNMRGYGDIHPTVGELRVGYIPVEFYDEREGRTYYLGEVKVTEAEIIASIVQDKDGTPKFSIGYGLCFGHNEVKAISMAILDRATQVIEPKHPSEDQEFVLYHVDSVESMGFCIHYKLPHYVTFQSDLDRLRKARAKRDEK